MDSSDIPQKMKARYNLDNVLLNDNFEYLTQFLSVSLDKNESDLKSQNQFFEKYQDLQSSDVCFDKEFVSPIRQKRVYQDNKFVEQLKSQDVQLDNLRRYGHFFANLNPLNDKASSDKLNQLKKEIPLHTFKGHRFYAIYCSSSGYEFDHIHSEKERQWLYSYVENDFKVNSLEQEKALKKLVDIHVFEHFLHTKFPGAKRFSIEGCEALAVFIEVIFDKLLKMFEKSNLVLGMAHRGRLSVLTQCFDLAEQEIFKLFLGKYDKRDTSYYSGDVKYHLGQKASKIRDTHTLDLTLLPNPSHLEYVNSVVLGYVRGLMDGSEESNTQNPLGILVHGDASIAGQGIVYESFQAMNLEGYQTEGTIHVVANNQIGFTADPQDSRSTYYCTDITKTFNIPVIHVNAQDIDAVIKASKLAYDYKQTFKKDIMIDLIGYRKYGHNEGDEPVFTQPSMYSQISKMKPAYEVYLDALAKDASVGHLRELASQRLIEVKSRYESLLADAKDAKTQSQKPLPVQSFPMEEMMSSPSTEICNQAIENLKKSIQRGLSLNLNSKLKRLLEARLQMLDGKVDLDWGCGEWVAYAVLLTLGKSIRISGQDSGRGTFSHRHAIWYDQTTNEPYHLFDEELFNANFNIWDSYLSESAILGFEYGYSLNHLADLTIWEAQFGDFANGAQVMIDQFIASGRSKWNQDSNLVLMLPHGFEGQGPEHSSARIERFLQLCAQDNIKVVNCTTPLSLYTALISHVCSSKKRPLVIFTPKSLLRHKKAVSSISDFTKDANCDFQTIVTDMEGNQNVKKYILCSGKIYYDLLQALEDNQLSHKVALIRFEQLYPVGLDHMDQLIQKIKPQSQIIWCQEEPQNAGPWTYFYMNIWPILSVKIEGLKIQCVSRNASASTATGFSSTHEVELKEILLKAMGMD